MNYSIIEETLFLTIVDEEGHQLEVEVLIKIEIEGQTYLAGIKAEDDSLDLEPLNAKQEDQTEGEDLTGEDELTFKDEPEVILLKVLSDEEGKKVLADIEDDEEWKMVYDAVMETLESDDDDEIVTITVDGEEITAEILAEIGIEDIGYVVLKPIKEDLEEASDEEGEVCFRKVVSDGEGGTILVEIEDDELDEVLDVWNDLNNDEQ